MVDESPKKVSSSSQSGDSARSLDDAQFRHTVLRMTKSREVVDRRLINLFKLGKRNSKKSAEGIEYKKQQEDTEDVVDGSSKMIL